MAGLLVALYAARGRILPAMARWLDVGQQPGRADYVFLLNGEANTRPFVAAAIQRAGLAPRVLVTRVKPSPHTADGIVPPYHDLVVQALLARGVPREAIELIGQDATHTQDEVQALAARLKAEPEAQVLVVTSAEHTRRARAAFSRVLGDRMRHVSFVSAPSDHFRPDNWWRTERGFIFVMSEYGKLGFYAVRYGWLGYWIVGGLLVVTAVVAWRYRRRRATDTGSSPAESSRSAEAAS